MRFYLLLFLEGIITFISPCVLPLLPPYITYFAAGKPGKRKTIINALGFVLGFTLVFAMLGAFAAVISGWLINYAIIVNIITGIIIIILGLNFTGIINIMLFKRTLSLSGGRNANVKDLHFFSSVLFGIVFSITWTPCIGAFLGTALSMVINQQTNYLHGMMMLCVYSLGLGVPFVLCAILLDRLKDAFAVIKRNYKIINMVSGIILIIIGILIASGQFNRILFSLTL
ncbi:MAG: cytochrome c biogenesis CcdA family protein [Treponema sp.]|nr:cytochrome c biogenesis CcdA family protein [Treponema sp.]